MNNIDTIFICKANIWRSQIAEWFYNHLNENINISYLSDIWIFIWGIFKMEEKCNILDIKISKLEKDLIYEWNKCLII